jgi:excisionase family DNA binding protein
MTEQRLLTIAETAARLGQSEATVRRRIAARELPAVRVGGGTHRTRMRVLADELERQLQVDAELAATRKRLAGVVRGRSDEGGPVDEAFRADVERLHGKPTAEGLKTVMDRNDLFNRVEREMADDPGLRQQLERLDDEAERFEHEARELARRIRWAEGLRKRAEEILEEEEDEG